MSQPAEQPLPGLLETHPEFAAYPPAPESLPSGEVAEGNYAVRYARSVDEVDELLRLRFRVFNLELAEGLEHHLFLGRVLGKVRM